MVSFEENFQYLIVSVLNPYFKYKKLYSVVKRIKTISFEVSLNSYSHLRFSKGVLGIMKIHK